MSVHSPSVSIAPVRVPKLKVRNRPPPEAALSQESLHLKASAGPYATTLEQYDDTATMTLYHSASSSLSRASPTSSVSSNSPPTKMHRSAARPKTAEHSREAQDFRFPYSVPGAPGEPDAIHPIFKTHNPLANWPNHGSRTHSSRDDQPTYAALTERNLASRDSQSSMMSGSGKKRGKIGLLGVITLKEPSAMALEQFAESQRKQAQLKGSRHSGSGTSDRKLPPEVPKVNSKWDGLPDRTRDAARSSKRDKKQPDSLLSRMADSRRPTSVSNSVTTFGSREGHVPPRLYIPADNEHSDAVDRPHTTSTSKTGSPPSSSHRTSNSSRARTRAGSAAASSKKSSKPDSRHSTAATSVDVPSPGKTFFLPDSPVEASRPIPNPSQTNIAAGIFPLTPTSPAAMQRQQRHKPRRSVSDPRIAIGMEDVTPLLSFLGNGSAVATTPPASPAASTPTARRVRPAVQVYWSASTQSFIPIHTPTTPVTPFSETLGHNPPPIPRRSSRRASSDSVPQADAIMRSLAALTAASPETLRKEDPIPVDIPPSPPPKPVQYQPQTPPSVPRAHVRAIFPPADMAERGGAPVKRTLESVLASGTAAAGNWISPHHAANAGFAPTTPTRHESAATRVRPAVSVRTGRRHRSNSASGALPPSPPASQRSASSNGRRPSLGVGEGNGVGLMHSHAHTQNHHHQRRPSTGSASFVASELSEQWFRSPQERLGLGVGTLKKSDGTAMPWNADAVGVGESAASANASPATPVAKKSEIVPWEANPNYGAEGDAVWDAAVKQMEGVRNKDGEKNNGKKKPRWSGFGKRKDDGRIVW